MEKLKLAKKKPTSASLSIEGNVERDEEVALFLLDRWVTSTYFCCLIEPVALYLLAPFANGCDNHNQFALQQQQL